MSTINRLHPATGNPGSKARSVKRIPASFCRVHFVWFVTDLDRPKSERNEPCYEVGNLQKNWPIWRRFRLHNRVHFENEVQTGQKAGLFFEVVCTSSFEQVWGKNCPKTPNKQNEPCKMKLEFSWQNGPLVIAAAQNLAKVIQGKSNCAGERNLRGLKALTASRVWMRDQFCT